MPLNLYRRHSRTRGNCLAGLEPEFRSYEADELLGVRHGGGSSLRFFFCGIFLSVANHSEGEAPRCPNPCLLSKLNAPTSCARSARLVICARARFQPSSVDAVSPLATVPSPTIPVTTPNSDSLAP